jgi:hypothetical protein
MTLRSVLLLTLAFLASASSSSAQQVTAGIKVGGQITDPLSGQNVLFSRFTVGPDVEIALPHRFSLEVDALHWHYAYTILLITSLHSLAGIIDTHISYWDFPLLLNWRVKEHRLSPFLAGGLSNRHTSGTGLLPPANIIQNPAQSIVGNPVQGIFVNTWTGGPVLSGGVSYIAHHFHVSPEVRYTHWIKPAVGVPTAWETNRNELDMLLGLTFAKH